MPALALFPRGRRIHGSVRHALVDRNAAHWIQMEIHFVDSGRRRNPALFLTTSAVTIPARLLQLVLESPEGFRRVLSLLGSFKQSDP